MHFIISALDKISITGCSMIYKLRIFFPCCGSQFFTSVYGGRLGSRSFKYTACSFGYWLVAGGWFILREKYCWLMADKSNEQADR
jgi:hypothetical protein